MKTKFKTQLCCYCGIHKATTKDHIPPKAIFNTPRPNDLITVPCCKECNIEASKYDERFKAYLGIHVARIGGEAERLFKEGVIPTAKHNRKLRQTVFQTMYPVYTATEAGIITGKAMAVPWDNKAHDVTIERIVRGLFFYHYGKIIGKNAIVTPYWFEKIPAGLGNELYYNSIGNGTFAYLYNKVEEGEYDSVWLFQFYESHFAGGIVLQSDESMPNHHTQRQNQY